MANRLLSPEAQVFRDFASQDSFCIESAKLAVHCSLRLDDDDDSELLAQAELLLEQPVGQVIGKILDELDGSDDQVRKRITLMIGLINHLCVLHIKTAVGYTEQQKNRLIQPN